MENLLYTLHRKVKLTQTGEIVYYAWQSEAFVVLTEAKRFYNYAYQSEAFVMSL